VQDRVNEQHRLFVRHIAKHRVNITPEQLAEVADAGVYIGRNAVKAGLADAVGTFDTSHKAAIQAAKEGKTFSMAITNEELRAWLTDPAPAPQAPPVPPAPDQTATPPAIPAAASVSYNVTAEQMTLLAAFNAINLKTTNDLRTLINEALTGRTVLAEEREQCIKMATALFTGDDANLSAVAEFINSAPLGVIRSQSQMYAGSLRAQGLAAPEGSATTRRFSTPPPVTTEGGTPTDVHVAEAPEKPTDLVHKAEETHRKKNYGHVVNLPNVKGATI